MFRFGKKKKKSETSLGSRPSNDQIMNIENDTKDIAREDKKSSKKQSKIQKKKSKEDLKKEESHQQDVSFVDKPLDAEDLLDSILKLGSDTVQADTSQVAVFDKKDSESSRCRPQSMLLESTSEIKYRRGSNQNNKEEKAKARLTWREREDLQKLEKEREEEGYSKLKELLKKQRNAAGLEEVVEAGTENEDKQFSGSVRSNANRNLQSDDGVKVNGNFWKQNMTAPTKRLDGSSGFSTRSNSLQEPDADEDKAQETLAAARALLRKV